MVEGYSRAVSIPSSAVTDSQCIWKETTGPRVISHSQKPFVSKQPFLLTIYCDSNKVEFYTNGAR